MPDIHELELEVLRTNRVKELMKSEVWNKDILPMLENMKNDLKTGLIWRKETRKCDEIAIACAYNSGAICQIEVFLNKLSTWIEIGDVAREKIRKMEEKGK